MIRQLSTGKSGSADAANRYFQYEVTGLRQTTASDSNAYQFRSSASQFVVVSYSQMNETMRRILRMGGTIVNIKPLTYEEAVPAAE